MNPSSLVGNINDSINTLDAATSESNTSEDWATIIDICEMADESETVADEIVALLSKRITHKNVNVVLFCLTLANSLLQNCGKNVQRALSSRIFVDSLLKQLANKKTHGTAKLRILELIQQWADMYKDDDGMGYLISTYQELKRQNYQFPKPNEPEKSKDKTDAEIQKKKEQEELELALALSLSTVKQVPNAKVTSKVAQENKKLFCVKVLYDYPGYEEGELSLSQGQIVKVYDNTTFHDWWKGEVDGKVGIFPSNYVQVYQDASSSITLQQVPSVDQSDEGFVFSNAERLDKFHQVASNFDHRSSITENAELQENYSKILAMRPRILKLLHNIHAKSDELFYVNNRYNSALGIYQRLMDMYSHEKSIQTPHYSNYPQQSYGQSQYPTYRAPSAQDGYYPAQNPPRGPGNI